MNRANKLEAMSAEVPVLATFWKLCEPVSLSLQLSVPPAVNGERRRRSPPVLARRTEGRASLEAGH